MLLNAIRILATTLIFANGSTVFHITVASNVKSTDCNITLAVGQVATIRPLGDTLPNKRNAWNVWGPGRDALGYGGNTIAIAHNRAGLAPYPCPGAPEGCLVIFLGGSAIPFPANKTELSVTGPGSLSLGPNDDNLIDNQGSLNVDITVQNP